MRVHHLLKNVNISAGAKNLGEKTSKYCQENKIRKELRERRGETFAVGSCKLGVVHISGDGKLTC